MSKASTKGKGKGPSATEGPAKGGDLGLKRDQKSNAKPERTDNARTTTGEGRGQTTQRGRGGGVAGGAGRGGQQRPAGGRGGGGAAAGSGAVAEHSSTYISKYPRLDVEKENKKLADLTSQIDAAYEQMNLVRERIDAIQEERKAIQEKNLESRDLQNEVRETKKKLKEEKEALLKALKQQGEARRQRLEEMNRQKKDLPIKDIKDTKKLIAANLEQLERDERAAEARIKTAATTGQDRGASKELQSIAAKKRLVRDWAKFAAEAEAPVDPALETRLKQVDEQMRKYNEEVRTAMSAANVVQEALYAKGDELTAVKTERSAIANTVEKLKKDRDAVYAVIREKRKEHQNKLKELQKAEREKKAVLDKEKRIKAKKEQRERALQELADPFKDEITLCDRLSTFLVNRQSKPKKGTTASGEQEEAKKGETVAEEEEEQEEEEEEKKEKEKEEEGAEDTEEQQQDEAAPAAAAATRGRKTFQFTNATHIDFELLSVQPPTSLDEIPAALESIARKKAFYERLAAGTLELRKKMEAQYDAELAALESPTPKKAAPKEENGKAPRTKKAKEQTAKEENKEEDKEETAKEEEEEKEEAEEEVEAAAQEAENGADE